MQTSRWALISSMPKVGEMLAASGLILRPGCSSAANQSVLQGVTFALCYRSRPYGGDPNKCIFESYAIERFPEGQEPKTEWVYAEPTAEKWGLVLSQDFSNMAAVEKGMRSRGVRGPLPNPLPAQKITTFPR